MFKEALSVTYHTARRIVVAVIGATVVLIGIAMLVLPGPGILAILAGLALLGLEFAWARVWLGKIKDTARITFAKITRRGPASGPPEPPQQGE